MVIINKNADYSQNAIGVHYPVSELANTYLSKYTKTLSNDRKSAFSLLIDTLNNAGILDKVTDMFFPCLASTLYEVIYNAKRDEQGLYTNIEKELHLMGDGVVGAYGFVDNPITPTYQPLHRANNNLQSYFLGYYDGGEQATLAYFRGWCPRASGATRKWVLSFDLNNYAQHDVTLEANKFYVRNVNFKSKASLTLDDVTIFFNGVQSSISKVGNWAPNTSNTTDDKVAVGTCDNGQYFNNQTSPVTLFIYANALTDEEIQLVNSAIVRFNQQFFM